MKQLLRSLKLVPLIFFVVSCNSSENNKLIVGKWSGSEWLIDGKASGRDVAGTQFVFDSTGKYTYEYSGSKEEGTYKVENNMLFTKPANQTEMMVKIVKLTRDSLVFDMNRSGVAETLTLLRK